MENCPPKLPPLPKRGSSDKLVRRTWSLLIRIAAVSLVGLSITVFGVIVLLPKFTGVHFQLVPDSSSLQFTASNFITNPVILVVTGGILLVTLTALVRFLVQRNIGKKTNGAGR